MARASIPTLLSLEKFARTMGIIPPHFNQAICPPLFTGTACSSVWFQHPWQSADSVSREDLALEIDTAENELASVVGYYPAPKFIAQEVYDYPQYLRRDLWQNDMSNVRGAPKSLNLRTGRFVGPGRRGVALVGTATTLGGTLTYTDTDGDGFAEDVVIVLPTTLTDVNLVKVFYPGHGGDPSWEIRSEKSKVIAGGFVTFHFYTWQFVDPDLQEEYPLADAMDPIDLTVVANHLASADVYYEYRDTTQASAEFLWNGDVSCGCGGSGCALCSYDAVEGCLYAKNAIDGIVSPVPGSYDRASDSWTASSITEGRDPDMVKLWYLAGDQDQRYLAGNTHDPLSDWWARVIAYLATARLERPFCACGNSHALAAWLREDLAQTPEGGGSRFTTELITSSPFGTCRGEVMAWMKVKGFTKRRMDGVAI
jgi:hypothetical protein